MSTPIAEVSLPTAKPAWKKPGAFSNVFLNWGGYLVAMAVNFFVSPYIVHHLGNAGYGVWTLLLSMTGYMGLLDLGVRGAVTRFVAKFHAEADHEQAGKVASSAISIFSVAAFVALLASVVLAFFALDILNIPPQYRGSARIVVLLIGLNMATTLVNGVFGGILVGLQRFDLINGIETTLSFSRAGAIVLALHLGYGIVTMAWIQLFFTAARWVVNIILTRWLYPELKIHFSLINKASLRLIFSFSVYSFLIHVSATLIYNSDLVVVGHYRGVVLVTFYAIAGSLTEYTRAIVSGISQTMTPMASSLEGQNDENKIRQIVLFSSRAGTMVVLPIAITFMLRGGSFIGLWMGTQFQELSGHTLWWLAWALVFWAANSVTSGSILGLGKHKLLVPMLITEGLFNLALSIYLVQQHVGIVGVAIGTAIPSWASSFVFWPWFVHRALRINPFSYMFSAWFRPMLGIVPFVVGTYAIESYWPATHLIIFFLQVALVLPLALGGYWLTCLDPEHREKFSQGISTSLEKVFARG